MIESLFLKKNSATKIVSLISETLVVLNCVAPFFVLCNKRTFSGFLTALLRFVVLCQVTLAFLQSRAACTLTAYSKTRAFERTGGWPWS